jgi:acyl dehydratase
MIDRKFIGHEHPPHTAEVEKGRLRMFAKAIGETDPVYSDEDAAKAAGHPALPVPPTFLFCLNLERPDPYSFLETLGVNLAGLLHGEQHFTYHRMAYAGDTLTFSSRISDVYDKKGGALEFFDTITSVSNQDGEDVATLKGVSVVRNVGGDS